MEIDALLTKRNRVYSIRPKVRGTSGTEVAMTRDEVVKKFRHNASRIPNQEKIDGAVDTILNLEELGDTTKLIKQLVL